MITIILLALCGIVLLYLGFAKSGKMLLPVAMISVVAVLAGSIYDLYCHDFDSIMSGMMKINISAIAFIVIILVSTLLLLPFSRAYAEKKDVHLAEYYALILFSLIGAVMMITYENFIMLFLGVEILSISMYILTGSDKRNLLSNEASLKYFLMGAFATGIMLFGFALVYGASGSFVLSEIAADSGVAGNPLMKIGTLMIVIGIAFKVGAAPFHFWTPDVYDGSPTLFTAFMSTVVKTAGFAAFYKLINGALIHTQDDWFHTVLVMTYLTIAIGNVLAVPQRSMKRMLAYSSISHAGYLMIAIVTLSDSSLSAILFYSAAYSIATIAAFGILMQVSAQRGGQEDFEAFNGLARSNPFLAFVMTVSMCSLAGIPLTAGFFGKFFILTGALTNGLIILVIFAVVNSAIGIYYYFRVVISMYMKEPSGAAITTYRSTNFILFVAVLLTILFGIYPDTGSYLLYWMHDIHTSITGRQ
jgi:NADH-quinone oxidoreductase subunit N